MLYNDIVHYYIETESINETLRAVRELYPDTPISKIKVQRVLITEGLWESKTSAVVCDAYNYRLTQGNAKISAKVIADDLGMSEKSVQQYLPYTKGEYGVGTQCAYWCEKYRQRKKAVDELAKAVDEKAAAEDLLWQTIILFSGYKFHTATGLPFSYEIKLGRNGEYTKELWIDRTDGKSLTWSSVVLAYNKIEKGRVYGRPKELSDSRGVSYLFPIFYRFGLIEVEERIKVKMKK